MSHVLHYSKSLSRGLKKVFSQKYITAKFCGAIELVSLNCRFSKERKNNLGMRSQKASLKLVPLMQTQNL